MDLFVLKILIGFTVGLLIGLTGLGGGVLLLPMLIFGLHIPAIIAVGSDALFNFFTKIPASIMHLLQRHSAEKSRAGDGDRQCSRLLSGSNAAGAPAEHLWCTTSMILLSLRWGCCWY